LDRQAEVRVPSRGYFLDIVAGMLRLDGKTAAPVPTSSRGRSAENFRDRAERFAERRRSCRPCGPPHRAASARMLIEVFDLPAARPAVPQWTRWSCPALLEAAD
jgi:hypothetical protein